MSTMTREQAEALRGACDTDAKLLSRKPKHELVAIERSEAAAAGWERIGPPVQASKDFYITSILQLRGFGIAKLNEAIHVMHHDVTWPDCEHCQAQERDRYIEGSDGIPYGPFARETGLGWPRG